MYDHSTVVWPDDESYTDEVEDALDCLAENMFETVGVEDAFGRLTEVPESDGWESCDPTELSMSSASSEDITGSDDDVGGAASEDEALEAWEAEQRGAYMIQLDMPAGRDPDSFELAAARLSFILVKFMVSGRSCGRPGRRGSVIHLVPGGFGAGSSARRRGWLETIPSPPPLITPSVGGRGGGLYGQNLRYLRPGRAGPAPGAHAAHRGDSRAAPADARALAHRPGR